MDYYTKTDAITLIALAGKNIGLGDIDNVILHSIRSYLENHILDVGYLSTYDILEFTDDICDHFSIHRTLHRRLSFQIAELLNVYPVFHFYYNGISIEEY